MAACGCCQRSPTASSSAIDHADVRVWLSGLAELVEAGQLSSKTVNNALTLLSVSFGQALDDGLIAANPCQRFRQLLVTSAETEFLRLNENPRYPEACPSYYRPLAGLLLGTGCRIPEAAAI